MIIIVGTDAPQVALHVSTWLGRHGRAHDYAQSLEAAIADRASTKLHLVTTDLAGLMHSEETLQETARIRRIVVLYLISTLADIQALPLWLRDHDYLHLIVAVDHHLADDWHWLAATVVVDQDAVSWARALDRVRSIILPRTVMTAAAGSTAVH